MSSVREPSLEDLRRERPQYLGRPLIFSDEYEGWLERAKALRVEPVLLSAKQRLIKGEIDPRMVPKTPSEFYEQTVGLYQSRGEAALSLKSMEGAASTFFLGYVDSELKGLTGEDYEVCLRYVRDIIRVDIQESADRIALVNQEDTANESVLGVWPRILQQDLVLINQASSEFLKGLMPGINTPS